MMQFRFNALAAIAASLLTVALLQGDAQAAPRGWKCDYSVTPLGVGPYRRYSRTYYYACYGARLRETRARARYRCRRLYACVTGPCLPLNFTPSRYCQREP